MFSLLLKQFYSNRFDFVLAGIILLLFPLFIFDYPGPPSPIVLAVMMTFFFTINIDMKEYKNSTDVFVNSLPVTRRQIITAKYVTPLIVGLVFITVGKVTLLLVDSSAAVQLADAFVAMIAVALFTAVYFPLYYKVGAPFTTIALVVLFLLFIMVLPMVFYTGVKSGFWGLANMWQQHSSLLLILFCCLTVAVVLVSRSISVRLYETKEF